MAEEAVAKEGGGGGDGEEKLLERVTVLDFDMLCATVALQTQGILVEKKRGKGEEEDEEDEEEGGGDLGGGVQRMWEGGVLDCLADRRIAIEAACCPCYRFGKNMRRANLGSCFLQGSSYFIISIVVLLNFIAFGITTRNCFLYVGIASAIAVGLYTGYFRTRIRKQFNIRGSNSYMDDCMSHLICPCCSLCQESRTLDMNNVQDGVWHGRGDTICIGSFGEGKMLSSAFHEPSMVPTRSPEQCSMGKKASGFSTNHAWSADTNHSEPLVSSAESAQQA